MGVISSPPIPDFYISSSEPNERIEKSSPKPDVMYQEQIKIEPSYTPREISQESAEEEVIEIKPESRKKWKIKPKNKAG